MSRCLLMIVNAVFTVGSVVVVVVTMRELWWVPGVTAPPSLDHCQVQFSASAGYHVCLPCPESAESRLLPAAIHRNGFRGAVLITQQRPIGDAWVLVCACGGCGARYRLPALGDAEPVIVACRRQGEVTRHQPDRGVGQAEWWHVVADRITAGYVFGSAGAS